jgi:DNA adenine methylase
MNTKDRYTGATILKSPLKLIGAKTKIRDLLYRYFPEHKTYCEPFMGTAGVLIGKVETEHEVIGDLNEYAINFFEAIKHQPDWFWQCYEVELERLRENGVDRFNELKKLVVSPYINWVHRAVCFYLITKVCMNGIWRLNKAGECNSSYCGQTHGRGFMDRPWFDAVRARIQHITFVNYEYSKTLDFYPSDFTFLDPPYHDCMTTYNGIGWGDEHFIKFARKIDCIKGRWLLTINDDRFIRELFRGYDQVEHKVNYSCSQTNSGRGFKNELLIANYDIHSIDERLQYEKENLPAMQKSK